MTSTRRSGARGKKAEEVEKGPAWIKWVLGCVGAFAVLLLIINFTGGGSAYQEEDAPHVLMRAREALQKGDLQGALHNVELAGTRKPDEATKSEIDAMRKELKEKIARDNDKPTLQLAERTLTSIRDFQRLYPDASRTRPQTRELARMCQAWLDRCRDTAKKYPDTAVLALEVQTLADRIGPGAGLSLPDDWDDVLFAIERKLQGTAPEYKVLMKQIEDFLGAHPGHAHAEDLKTRRNKLESEAMAAFDRDETATRRLIGEGKIDEANKLMEALRNAIVIDSMAVRWQNLDRDIRAKK